MGSFKALCESINIKEKESYVRFFKPLKGSEGRAETVITVSEYISDNIRTFVPGKVYEITIKESE
jgi:hypothetical protein